MSHPTWVRGLKHALSGCELGGELVAPYVGAWIETSRGAGRARSVSRTLRGCVD